MRAQELLERRQTVRRRCLNRGRAEQEVGDVAEVDGVALVAAVGLLGVALLVVAHRLGAARERLSAEAARAELARRVVEAETALVKPVLAAERGVDDLAEVQAAVKALLARAEAVRELYAGDTAA
jgi:hypothetical protein